MKIVVDVTRPQIRALRNNLEALYSWDNNPTNKAARISGMGLKKGDVLPLPTYSPDLHQIVEHAIAQFKTELLKAVMKHDGQAMTTTRAQELAVEVFSRLDKDAIHKNGQRLVCCWDVVKTAKGEVVKCKDEIDRVGTGGDWAPADLR